MRCVIAACLLLVASARALAVPPGTVSWSAEVVCMMRAIASQHPDPVLRNPDQIAAQICPRPFELRDYESARAAIDADPESFAGYFYVNARTHCIDAAVDRAARGGAAQIVILGAGFDSRAYRLHDAHPGLRFFEVDLPAMIEAKKERLASGFVSIPEHVRFVPIDFDTQSLDDVLPAAGYRSSQQTLFIFEGVTMYVGEAATEATLEFVRRHAARGSVIVFDYLLREVVEGDSSRFYAAATSARSLAQRGEPLVTGWSRDEAVSLVRRHGLDVVDDLGTEELVARYLIARDGRVDGRILEGNRILQAIVP